MRDNADFCFCDSVVKGLFQQRRFDDFVRCKTHLESENPRQVGLGTAWEGGEPRLCLALPRNVGEEGWKRGPCLHGLLMQWHFAPRQYLASCSKTEREKMQDKSPGHGSQPVPALGRLIESASGPQDARFFPSRDPQPWHVALEWFQAAQHLPPECQNPLRSQRKSHPRALNIFLLCSSFCRAIGAPGWQHRAPVWMAWLLLEAFPLIRNNSPRLATSNEILFFQWSALKQD